MNFNSLLYFAFLPIKKPLQNRLDNYRGSPLIILFVYFGDIIATSNQRDINNKTAEITIASISDYQEVYKMVRKLQTDVCIDIMCPNALRPDENPCYKTKYKGELNIKY